MGAAPSRSDNPWSYPEKQGWLGHDEGTYLKTRCRRWFILKQGKLYWFEKSQVNRYSVPIGVIRCTQVESVVHKRCVLKVNGRKKLYAGSEGEKIAWVHAIQYTRHPPVVLKPSYYR